MALDMAHSCPLLYEAQATRSTPSACGFALESVGAWSGAEIHKVHCQPGKGPPQQDCCENRQKFPKSARMTKGNAASWLQKAPGSRKDGAGCESFPVQASNE